MLEVVLRLALCVVFPPLAVYDKGCGSMLLVLLLTALGWIPGTVCALILCVSDEKKKEEDRDISQPEILSMILRFLLCVIFPPLGVFDKGCGSMLLVFLFTLFGWVPGIILALLICVKDQYDSRSDNGDDNDGNGSGSGGGDN